MSDIKRTRTISNIFENKSGTTVSDGVMKLVGTRDGFPFQLTSIVSSDSGRTSRILIDISDSYSKANEYGIGNKLTDKIEKKFSKYENVNVVADENDNKCSVSITFPSEEFLTSVKTAIKFEKKVGIFTKMLLTIQKAMDKIIANKENRKKIVAERRAAKKALEKEAAESIPGAVAADSSITGVYDEVQ